MSVNGWNLENSYAGLPEFFYSEMDLNKVSVPKLVVLNDRLAKNLGLDIDELKSPEGVSILAGNTMPKNSKPVSQAYSGHQFGHFTMLGDGRALLLGEQLTPAGEKFDIQLKGSGRTPYSRGGDGRAALGPMLREYIISEAMYHLNIPTTRSLAVVTTGEHVIREDVLKGAVLTRVASSHIRVGTFEYASNFGTIENVKQLADYTINRHFSYVTGDTNPYLSFLKEVVKKQASLISKWQLVGFIHGVMNTDNMAISGETIDYGPCAFMDTYNPNTAFSSIDTKGRYAYKNQPEIAVWNLSRFAETLLHLIDDNENKAVNLAKETVTEFYSLYENYYISGMCSKLGIFNKEKEDEKLIEDLLNIMHKYNEDYTNTFVKLTFEKDISMDNKIEFKQWHNKYSERLKRQIQGKEDVFELMKSSNPAIIPRNYRVEEALYEAVEKDNYIVLENLLHALSKSFTHTADLEEYAKLPPPSNCQYKTFCGT